MENQERIEAVCRMQTYIEAHLEDPITLHLLAEQAGYSPWHCAKIFKELTGKAPFEYIRSCRLSQAALRLRDYNPKIVDVAMDFVFDSHEGFTRAFRRQFGMSPKDYKKNTPPLPLFHPWSVRDSAYYYSDTKEELPPLSGQFFVQVRTFPKRKLLLKRARTADDYFSYCEEAGCDVWGLLCSVREALYEPIGMWLPDRLRPRYASRYAQGVEVPEDYRGIVPPGFELLELPECRMMLFQTEPYEDFRFEEAVTGLAAAIDGYRPQTDGYVWADNDAPRIQLNPQGWRGYIEARPVREA